MSMVTPKSGEQGRTVVDEDPLVQVELVHVADRQQLEQLEAREQDADLGLGFLLVLDGLRPEDVDLGEAGVPAA